MNNPEILSRRPAYMGRLPDESEVAHAPLPEIDDQLRRRAIAAGSQVVETVHFGTIFGQNYAVDHGVVDPQKRDTVYQQREYLFEIT